MSGFKRCLKREMIDTLLDINTYEGRIFKTILYPDIMTGKIFMAIRVNKIDFYVGGNRLMEYSGECFKANPRIFGKSEKSRMIDIRNVFEPDWESKFASLVKACYAYSSNGKEQGERKIMQSYFPVFDNKEAKVIVLDREVRINDGNGRKCDWLLFDIESGLLKFVEVKTSDNKEIKPHKDGTFDVIEQLNGYSRQYEANKETITEQYKVYVDSVNELLGLDLPKPDGMFDTKAGLAIFGDRDEIHPDLIEMQKPFIGEYKPALTSSLEDIWKHFATTN